MKGERRGKDSEKEGENLPEFSEAHSLFRAFCRRLRVSSEWCSEDAKGQGSEGKGELSTAIKSDHRSIPAELHDDVGVEAFYTWD